MVSEQQQPDTNSAAYQPATLAPFSPDATDRYLAAIIAHQPLLEAPPGAASDADSTAVEALFEQAAGQGIGALLHQRLQQHPQRDAIGRALQDRLTHWAQTCAARELLQRKALLQALAALQQAGLDYLVTKGTGLAYSLYDPPYVRERCDTDLLFADADSARRAGQALEALGYRPGQGVEGDLYNYEKSYVLGLPLGEGSVLDLHWQAFNNNVYGPLLPWTGLRSGARSLPALDQGVHTLGLPDALIYAAVHRLCHAAEGNANRLIWLYDIALIAAQLDHAGWHTLGYRATRWQVAHACLDALRATAQLFPCPVPAGTLAELTESAAAERVPHGFFRGELGSLLAELRVLPSWVARVRLLGQHLFPAPAYMRAKYHSHTTLGLPWLYIKRLGQGLARRLRPSDSGDSP